MELKDFQAITSRIAQNLSNQGLITELLTQLNEDYATESTNKENLSKQVGEHSETIKQLQQTNMNLFLKVSQPVASPNLNSDKKLEYNDLFDEKGGLK